VIDCMSVSNSNGLRWPASWVTFSVCLSLSVSVCRFQDYKRKKESNKRLGSREWKRLTGRKRSYSSATCFQWRQMVSDSLIFYIYIYIYIYICFSLFLFLSCVWGAALELIFEGTCEGTCKVTSCYFQSTHVRMV
jgi:hypothetical protein